MLLHLVTVVLALLVAYGGESTPPPPAEPGWHGEALSERQLRGLALYVTDSEEFAAFAVRCWRGESWYDGGYRVGAVGENADGSRDHGLPQINDYWWRGDFDFERIRSDPVYAMQAAWVVYRAQGPEAWKGEGC